MLKALKKRWKLKSTTHVWVALLVFAATGLTISRLKIPLLTLLLGEGPFDWWISVLYYLFVLPIYLAFLSLYGYILGMGYFFIPFTKKTITKIFPFLK